MSNEWFHFECIGFGDLRVSGSWFCQDCTRKGHVSITSLADTGPKALEQPGSLIGKDERKISLDGTAKDSDKQSPSSKSQNACEGVGSLWTQPSSPQPLAIQEVHVKRDEPKMDAPIMQKLYHAKVAERWEYRKATGLRLTTQELRTLTCLELRMWIKLQNFRWRPGSNASKAKMLNFVERLHNIDPSLMEKGSISVAPYHLENRLSRKY